MKQWFAMVLAVWLLAVISGCGSAPASSAPSPSVPAVPVSAAGQEIPKGEHKVLIAYFTWAENTHVEDPSAVDPDA